MILDVLEESGVAVDEDGRRYVRRADGHWRWEDEEPEDAPFFLFGYRNLFLGPDSSLRWAPARPESQIEVYWSDRIELLIDGRRWSGPVRVLTEEPFGRRYVEIGT